MTLAMRETRGAGLLDAGNVFSAHFNPASGDNNELSGCVNDRDLLRREEVLRGLAIKDNVRKQCATATRSARVALAATHKSDRHRHGAKSRCSSALLTASRSRARKRSTSEQFPSSLPTGSGAAPHGWPSSESLRGTATS